MVKFLRQVEAYYKLLDKEESMKSRMLHSLAKHLKPYGANNDNCKLFLDNDGLKVKMDSRIVAENNELKAYFFDNDFDLVKNDDYWVFFINQETIADYIEAAILRKKSGGRINA